MSRRRRHCASWGSRASCGNRHEFRRRDIAPLLVIPAHQRLIADNGTVAEADLAHVREELAAAKAANALTSYDMRVDPATLARFGIEPDMSNFADIFSREDFGGDSFVRASLRGK